MGVNEVIAVVHTVHVIVLGRVHTEFGKHLAIHSNWTHSPATLSLQMQEIQVIVVHAQPLQAAEPVLLWRERRDPAKGQG